MRILIQSVSHSDQRYDTCGDWYFTSYSNVGAKPTLHIRVSELADPREMYLIAIHELIEAVLCQHQGITTEDVDAFDLDFLGLDENEHEPGDDPRAPYYRQHQAASVHERALALMMDVHWLEYEAHVQELSK